MALADVLSGFAEAATPGRGALAMMRLSVFDWACCGVAGCDEPVARAVRDLVLHEGGRGEAGLFGGGAAPARGAALVNGTISHALDYDDTHFAHIGHPSVAVIPAALALAQRDGSSGTAFLRAALLGVEASVRVGVWLGRGHYQVGFHQTATAGCFGAAVAAGVLAGLERGQMAQALGLAATRAAGLKSQFGTMGKPYNAGMAAASGVEVALLARAGMISDPAALDGAQGFGPTHHGAGDAAAFDGIAEHWLFEEVSHKFHACCHGTHAMLEALRGTEAPPQEVAQIRLWTHPRWMTVCNKPRPETGLEAKFSYRMTAAMALLGHDTARLDSFSDALCGDARLVDLRDRIEVFADPEVPETAARVEITRSSGEVLSLSHDLNAPMALDLRADKLRAKGRALVGAERAASLWALCVEGDADPARLGELLG